jgi:hypothetical protein
MKTLKISLFVMLLGVVIASCSKTGPAGPTGPAGANGVANITTTTFTVTPGQWNTITAGASYQTMLSVSALTNANTDNIEVSATGNMSAGWGILPVSNLIYNGDEMAIVYRNGQVEVDYFYSSAPTVTVYFKVSVIPPAMIHQHPGLTKNQIIQLNQ